MAVSGIPEACENHAKWIAKLSLDMMDMAKSVQMGSELLVSWSAKQAMPTRRVYKYVRNCKIAMRIWSEMPSPISILLYYIYCHSLDCVVSSHSHIKYCQFATRARLCIRFYRHSKSQLAFIRAKLSPVLLVIVCRVIVSLGIRWIWPVALKQRAQPAASMSAKRHSSEYAKSSTSK